MCARISSPPKTILYLWVNAPFSKKDMALLSLVKGLRKPDVGCGPWRWFSPALKPRYCLGQRYLARAPSAPDPDEDRYCDV